MSFKPSTEKIKKKKIGICSILGRIRIKMIRIRNTARKKGNFNILFFVPLQ